MNVIVLGAGIIGISTAWYLLEEGHDVEDGASRPEPTREGRLAAVVPVFQLRAETFIHSRPPRPRG